MKDWIDDLMIHAHNSTPPMPEHLAGNPDYKALYDGTVLPMLNGADRATGMVVGMVCASVYRALAAHNVTDKAIHADMVKSVLHGLQLAADINSGRR